MKGIPNTEYISFRKSNGYYFIQKRINGKHVLFGHYKFLEEAIKWRDYFKQRNWNVDDRLTRSRGKFIEEYSKGKYIIRKTINGKRLTYGVFTDLEKAKKEVELLKKSNWDLETLCDVYE